MGEGWGRNVKP